METKIGKGVERLKLLLTVRECELEPLEVAWRRPLKPHVDIPVQTLPLETSLYIQNKMCNNVRSSPTGNHPTVRQEKNE